MRDFRKVCLGSLDHSKAYKTKPIFWSLSIDFDVLKLLDTFKILACFFFVNGQLFF